MQSTSHGQTAAERHIPTDRLSRIPKSLQTVTMEESISGFKVTGDWKEVVAHGERVTQALRELDVPETHRDAFYEWENWRPKAHEQLDADVSEKTAEQAHTDEGKGEQAGQSPDADLKKAGEKLSESYEKLGEDTDEAVSRWGESLEYVTRAADSAGRQALRKVEDTVYKRVMTQLAPYYFDNELISANIERTSSGTFAFEININDDALKTDVAELLRSFEEDLKRWHVTTEKRTERIEAAEGVESPETPGEQEDSKFPDPDRS